MDNQKAVLSLLFLAVLASGCSHVSGPGATESEGDASITVNRFEVRPTTINSGGEVNIWAEAENTGTLTGKVAVGENGKRVLRDFCSDIFSLSEDRPFSASSSTVQETRDKYTLEPGQSLNMRWTLKQQGRVPIYGIPCDLRLEMPFNYTASAFRQIQLKKNREVEGSQNLQSESSTGPLTIAVETVPGVTGKHYTFVPKDEEVKIQIQFQNKNPTGEYRKGLIDVHRNSLSIKASGSLKLDEAMVRKDRISGQDSSKVSESEYETAREFRKDQITAKSTAGTTGGGSSSGSEYIWVTRGYEEPRCEVPDQIRMFKGRSTIISCEVPFPDEMEDPGQISEISVSANYTYIKNLGQRTVQVEQAAE